MKRRKGARSNKSGCISLRELQLVPLTRETSNSATQATEEVVGRSGRPIGALSEAKKRREINKSGCISLRELQLVPLTGETSNTLLETFQEWQELLKDVDFDELDKFESVKPEFEEPQP